MSLTWARVSLFIMEFLIFGKPYFDNTTDIDKTNKQNNNVYFQNFYYQQIHNSKHALMNTSQSILIIRNRNK